MRGSGKCPRFFLYLSTVLIFFCHLPPKLRSLVKSGTRDSILGGCTSINRRWPPFLMASATAFAAPGWCPGARYERTARRAHAVGSICPLTAQTPTTLRCFALPKYTSAHPHRTRRAGGRAARPRAVAPSVFGGLSQNSAACISTPLRDRPGSCTAPGAWRWQRGLPF